MNTKKLLSLYGLKWNPFSPDLPVEALLVTKKIESFIWRVENLIQDGGFALITGEPGTGKSVALRLLSERLKAVRDVTIGVLTRPQSMVSDFYRELSDVFQVKLSASNRWGGFKVLRERWKAYMEANLLRPLLLIDEAQAMAVEVLSELRLLSSTNFDSTSILTVVLSGDARLPDLFRHEELVPLGSRIRTRLVLEYAGRDELLALLQHAVTKAGNPRLMTEELMDTLVDHATGNYRVLMTMAGELLMAGMAQDGAKLDEKLYLEIFQIDSGRGKAKTAQRKEGRG
jgi:general secretion pathway protein A